MRVGIGHQRFPVSTRNLNRAALNEHLYARHQQHDSGTRIIEKTTVAQHPAVQRDRDSAVAELRCAIHQDRCRISQAVPRVLTGVSMKVHLDHGNDTTRSAATKNNSVSATRMPAI